jgi:hypothetical protein
MSEALKSCPFCGGLALAEAVKALESTLPRLRGELASDHPEIRQVEDATARLRSQEKPHD